MVKRIVIFDLDGTLLRGDSFVRFLLGFLKHRPMRIFNVLHLPLAVLVHKTRIRNNAWLKETFLRAFFGGLPKTDIENYANTFVDALIRNALRPTGLERLQKHQNNSDYVVLATASPDIYVRRFAKKLSFDKVICTELGYHNEICTGSLLHGNCFGITKLQQIEDSLGHACIDVAYSDHDADIPLLNAARQAFAISPNKALAKFANTYGLTIENWD